MESLKLNKRPQSSYQPGDLVFYDVMRLEAARNKNKHSRWLGPYKVLLYYIFALWANFNSFFN
jgi:hypothetical protein